MCACLPDLAAEPACPLCPPSGGGAHGGDDRGDSLAWTRKAERLDHEVPFAVNLVTSSLIVRLWSPVPEAPSPELSGVVRSVRTRAPLAQALPMDPPPPRAGVARA